MTDISFRYDPASDARLQAGLEVRSVAVAGSWNNWDKTRDRMTRGADGAFARSIAIPSGLHRYKFVVNGEIWLEDLSADSALRADDGHGGYNSGIMIEKKFIPWSERGLPEPVDIPQWASSAIWYQIFPERFRNGDPSNDPRLADIREGLVPGWEIHPWGSDWYEMAEWERAQHGSVFHSIFRRRYGGDLAGVRARLDYLQDLGVTAIYLNPVFRAPSLHKYDASTLHHIEETFGPDPDGDRRMLAEANETTDPASWVWTSADLFFLDLVKEIHARGMRVIIDGVFNHTGRDFFAFRDLLQRGEASPYKEWYEISRWDAALRDGFEYKGWFGVHSLPELKRSETDLALPVKDYIFNITRRWMAPEGRVADGIDGWRLDVAFCVPHGFWKDWRKHVKSINEDAYITGEVVEEAPEFLEGDEFDGLMNYPFAYAVTEFFIDRGGPDDIARHKLIAAFQILYPGAPMIYYGDEVGMTGANDPDCRKPMLWDDIAYAPEAIDPRPGITRLVETNAPDKNLRDYYRKLIALRKSQPAFSGHIFITRYAPNSGDIFAFTRRADGSLAHVIFNAGERAQGVAINLGEQASELFNALDAKDATIYRCNADGLLTLTIPRLSAIVLLPVSP